MARRPRWIATFAAVSVMPAALAASATEQPWTLTWSISVRVRSGKDCRARVKSNRASEAGVSGAAN